HLRVELSVIGLLAVMQIERDLERLVTRYDFDALIKFRKMPRHDRSSDAESDRVENAVDVIEELAIEARDVTALQLEKLSGRRIFGIVIEEDVFWRCVQ